MIGIVILAVVVFLNLPVPVSMRVKSGTRDNIAPFQNVMSLVMGRIGGAVSFLFVARRAVDEKQRMSGEIVSLRLRLSDQELMIGENAELRRLLGFRVLGERDLIPCRVILRSGAAGWWQTVRLDKGSEAGIESDMAVISMDGVIGQTIEVSRFTSTVLLITDATCKVACRLRSSGAFGIVGGRGVSVENPTMEMLYPVRSCLMEYISMDAKVLEGGAVLTSGLGGVYPGGLLIGHVSRTYDDASGLYRCADIVPSAKLGKLKYVFVVNPESETQQQPADAGSGDGDQ